MNFENLPSISNRGKFTNEEILIIYLKAGKGEEDEGKPLDFANKHFSCLATFILGER